MKNEATKAGVLALAEIRNERGLMARIAAALDISQQAVSLWKRIPAERVLQVEDVTGIPRHKLRPDIYPKQGKR